MNLDEFDNRSWFVESEIRSKKDVSPRLLITQMIRTRSLLPLVVVRMSHTPQLPDSLSLHSF